MRTTSLFLFALSASNAEHLRGNVDPSASDTYSATPAAPTASNDSNSGGSSLASSTAGTCHFDKIVAKPGSVITFGRKLTDVSGALNLDASMTKEGCEKNGGTWVVADGSSASDNYDASPAAPTKSPDASSYTASPAIQEIEDVTNSWAAAVTVENNPRLVSEHFCSDGILWGTRSKEIRVGNDEGGAIERYFDYFAKLPGIAVKKADYNIARITPDVYVNNAIVQMREDGLDAPFDARMTFIFRHSDDFKLNNGWCLFELHSSSFPERNENLKAIANRETAE